MSGSPIPGNEVAMKRIAAIVTVLSMLIFLCACADQTDTDKETTNIQTVTAPSDEETRSPYDISDDLPLGLDFEGRVINVVSSDRSWWIDEVTVPEFNGEVVNDAVYNRNLAVETRLNLKINNIKIPYANSNSSTVDAVKIAVQSGTRDYDIAFVNAYQSLYNSLNGIYHNLYDIEYLDLGKPYWSQGVNQAIEFRGAQYAATGSIALSTMRFAFVTIFNKDIFDQNSLTYLYEPVRQNKWTLDYQYSLVRDFYSDLNGNNREDIGDLYGFITNEYICSDPYWAACEVHILGRDADGAYKYVLDIGKLSDVVDNLLTLYNATGTLVIVHKAADAEQDDMRKMFAEGHGAMVTLRLMEVEHSDMRNMESPYGIVPIPKYNEEQENYHTLMHDQFTVVSVTATVLEEDYGVMGAFLEAMASESHRRVIPAYYESALKYKYSHDPESWEMLDIVIENITTDAGIIYTSALSNIHHNLRTIMGEGINTVASRFKTILKVMERVIGNLNSSLEKLADR
jgi:ABC-type glycerol-3-phosphate transport system substrate-binding protein